MGINETTEIIAFFTNPASYPHEVSEVRHIETHISHVFLTGAYAFKVKKALKLDFLDFQSLTNRKHFCERELELNRRFAPKLYEEVLAVSRVDGKLRFGLSDEVVEYCVKMKEFKSDALFSVLLKEHKLTRLHFQKLTTSIARFHSEAVAAPGSFTSDHLKMLINDNLNACLTFVPDLIERGLFAQCKEQVLSELETKAAAMEARNSKYVKLLHGDLHLHNICLYEEEPTLFDGIEFNDEYASCDVWADLAFLLMDLDFHNAFHFSNLVLNSYLELTDDYAGIELLRLFMSYRALTRAKISCIEYAEKVTEKKKSLANSYFEFVHSKLVSTSPRLIAVGGFSGSGKSTVSRSLAEKTSAVHLKSDAIRKHLVGVLLTEKAPESAYSEKVSNRVYGKMLSRAKLLLLSGYSVILDAAFLDLGHRQEAKHLAENLNFPFMPIWCDVPNSVAIDRLNARGGDVSDADAIVFEKQIAKGVEALDWKVIDANRDVPEIVKGIMNSSGFFLCAVLLTAM